MSKLLGYLRLARPANIVTAIADILLGFAASGNVIQFSTQSIQIVNLEHLLWLCLATIGLYGGGVVMNDVFDADLDAEERPERPIPSGLISLNQALLWGISLLLLGILAANQVSSLSVTVAIVIAFLAIYYDGQGKHHSFLGPINMGLCRGFNVLLGITAGSLSWNHIWLFMIPILYIMGITTISRGEVKGDNPQELKIGLVLYALVFGILLYLYQLNQVSIYLQLGFIILLGWLILRPLFRAIQNPTPTHIGKAVKMGVISLIILDASLAMTFAGPFYSLLMLALLPLSLGIAKFFAVT